MTTTPVTLIKGDKVSLDTDYRDALPVNMYAVEREILGAAGYMLVFPGLSIIAEGVGVDRGAAYNERFEAHYRVSGTELIQLSVNDTRTNLGTIPGSTQAAMAYSFNTQAVVADKRMFLWDEASLSEVVDSDLGDPIDIVWVDGYYFLTDGEYIYHTDIGDETSIDPLKFATSEFSPDPTKGLSLTQDDKVMVWNRYTLEYFVNDASANFAFQRLETRAQKIGIAATHAKCESEGAWYITGGRKEEALGVHVVSVGSAKKVSTREVDKVLAQYTEPELSDMRMESVEEDNIHFIYAHLPNETLCLNVTIAKSQGLANAWFILKTGTGDDNYRGINGVFDAKRGKWVFGDKRNSNIGLLDNTVCTQYEEIAEWLLYTPLLALDGQTIDELEIETLPGNVVGDFVDNLVAEFRPLQQISRDWYGMTTGLNGDIYATVSGGDIYKQTGGVGKFLALGQMSRLWRGMATGLNGDVYAAVANGDIYKQTGGVGDFIALGQTSRFWQGMATGATGDVYSCEFSGDIYKQTGGVGDFIALGQMSRLWQGMTTSLIGDVYASVANGDIYKQTGGVGDFVALGQTSRAWQGMATGLNGDVYAAASSGDIYKQTGGVGDFVALGQTSRVWRGMATGATGDVYACEFSGDVYKYDIRTFVVNVVKVAFSMTYDGVNYSQEWWPLYGEANKYNQRFYVRRLGNVTNWVGFKLRGVSKSRMAFALLKVTHG